ncbi:MAG: alpha/beta fold hydrolase [Chloroflexi bacterium]|nr:alpha/beta fold hydrolase [Chloroflexota bacterium]
MPSFFQDPLFEQFASSLALGAVSHGGGEPGEIAAICAQITDGDNDSWYAAWSAAADQLVAAGAASAGADHHVSARESYLRATSYYGLAYHPLFGAPVDQRLLDAFGKQRTAFDRFAALLEPAGERLEIECDGARMPAYLFKAGTTTEHRPLLIATNGYDATIYEMYLAQAVPALRRGYDCLLFDGPGQGAVLYEQGVTMRPDWEHVVGRVVDVMLERDDVDHERMVLTGWSLGGYLALRAATAEQRLAGCIADPGLFGILAVAGGGGQPDAAELEKLSVAMEHDRMRHWAIVQRGFWVNGASSLADYLQIVAAYTLEGRLGGIRCPTLLTAAENDPLSTSAPRVLDGLRCRKALIQFRTSEGAGEHCEMGNRSLVDQRVFDWLDQMLEEEHPSLGKRVMASVEQRLQRGS